MLRMSLSMPVFISPFLRILEEICNRNDVSPELQSIADNNVSAYSDSCREVSLIGTGAYSALRFPDIKLTRLENDASCLKYMQKSFKRKRFKSSIYDSDSYETDSLALSGGESSADESSASEYTVSDTESSSDESIEKAPRNRFGRFCSKVQSTNTSVSWNPSKDTQSSSANYAKKVPDQFLKFPIIKLIRLENDENCHKYLNQNFCLKMQEKKADKKLNPIVIITNPNVRGKHKTSFMIKKPKSKETGSEGSCYTSIDGSNHDLVSCNNKNSLSLNLSSTNNHSKPSNLLSRQCSITLEPLSVHSLRELADKRKLSVSSESAPPLIDLVSEDASSSFEEDNEPRCLETENFEINSNISEPVSEESSSSEIMRCFEPDTQNSENESTELEEENSTSNILKSEKKKVYDSGIGISDDTVSMSDDSFILMSTVLIPNDDPDFGDAEERYIVEFIDDDVFERLRSQVNNPVGSPPVNATCDLCSDTFTSRPSLYQHMKQKHNCADIYECAHCGQIFNLKACLVYHLYARLNAEDDNLSETHVCPKNLCSKEDFTDSELEFLSNFCSNHASLHNQLIKTEIPDENQNCIVEGDNIENDSTTAQYSPKMEESWACVPVGEDAEQCSQSALISSVSKDSKRKKLKRKSSKKIGRASRKSRKSSDKASSNYICHLCNKDCSNKKMLFDHLSENHYHIYYLECASCEKLFQNSVSLASHYVKKACIQKKKGPRLQKTLQCEVCKKCYKSKAILRKHKMNIHNLYVPAPNGDFLESLLKLPPCDSVLNCLFCYKSYSSSIELLGHERDSHNYFSCFEPLCLEKFYSRTELERHLFFHFTGGESSFCGFCSKLFFTRQYLESHIKWHLQNDSKIKIEN